MPVVWLIDAYRAGERAQLQALVAALGWPCEVKQLAYRKFEFRTNLFRGSDLRGIDKSAAASLQAPWPDLVISAGMRNEPVCRWIRNQSGGRTRIVHVGRPWADPSRFDLVVTTPQYRIPQRANVLHNALTLHQVNEQRLQQAAQQWQQHFAQLQKPLTAVMVGGDSGPFTFGTRAGARLAAEVGELLAGSGGSALISTSSRTAAAAAAALEGALSVPHYFYHWQPADSANPYFGLLALADQFVVTADSISMLSEACATGKPVYMFDLGQGGLAMHPQAGGSWRDTDWRLGALLYRGLMRWGWQKLTRDISLVHLILERSGRARWLGSGAAPAGSAGTVTADVEAAVAAVHKLFEQNPAVA